jgi:phosphoribosylamine--glycine ligase
VSVFQAVANETLADVVLDIDPRSATTVMLVSGGYPEEYQKGKTITGLESIDDAVVFHAGTKLKNNTIVSNGGRVLAITAYGNDFKEAIKKSYENIAKLHFDTMYYRKDIGNDLL